MDVTALTVHEDGLRRVLSEWSGIGSLYSAVAATALAPTTRDWSREDVQRRAMRILLLQCSPLLRRWPKSAREWDNHLPTLSDRQRFWSDAPQSRVDWARTRRSGWPPSSFAIRRRRRSTDQLTLSVLSWTLGKLKHALSASQRLTGPHVKSVIDELSEDVEKILVKTLPIMSQLDESDETLPTRDDIRAVRASGWPWNVVAEVAGFFAAVERGGAEALARTLLRPDGFPDAVFHLSVLGSVLIACERAGGSITSLRPIGYMTRGPVYRIEYPDSAPWDLWCEAAACWDTYGVTDNYRQLAASLMTADGEAFQARSIRPDIVLARQGDCALVIECKYPEVSRDPGYVAQGLYQAAFYAHQLKPAFGTLIALSVGPDELVPHRVVNELAGVQVGLANPAHLAAVVQSIVGSSTQAAGAI